MRVVTEVYFKKENITSDDWQIFIKEISRYHGFLKHWILFVQIENYKIHYYLETSILLPTAIETLEFCMFQTKEEFVFFKNVPRKLDYFSFLEDNLITLYEKFYYKKNILLDSLKIIFRPIRLEKIYSRSYLYFKKENYLYKRKLFLSTPTLLLNVSFQNQKMLKYIKIPAYFNIQKSLDILDKKTETSILKIDSFPYVSTSLFLDINHFDFFKHSLILGSSGCGKSKFISSMISKLDPSDYKVIVIDPHASLEQEIGGLANTQKIDFMHKNTQVNLFKMCGNNIISSVELFLSLFQNLIGEHYNMKLERVLRHSLHLLLIGNCFSFHNLRKLILEIEYRNEKLRLLQDQVPKNVLSFFYTDFNELKTKSYMESIAPILAFIDEMQLLPAFNDTPEKSLESILLSNFLTIFSLDRTLLGDHIVKTIASFVMQQLLEIIQIKKYKEKIMLVVDEVALVENPILIRMLSEARKYGLFLVLISQYFNQVTPLLKDAIFANTINYYIFRVSRMDATLLADHLNMEISEENEKEDKIKILTELNNRECIVRVATNGELKTSFKAETINYQALPYQEKFIEEIKPEQERNKDFSFSWNRKSKVSLKDILRTLSTTKRK